MNRLRTAACGLFLGLVVPCVAAADVAGLSGLPGMVAAVDCDAQVAVSYACLGDGAVNAVVADPGYAAGVARAYGATESGVSALIAPMQGGVLWSVDAGSQFGLDKRIIKKGAVLEDVVFRMDASVVWPTW